MAFEIVRNDITCMEVDAIVNAANHKPIIGDGVDRGVHKAAGPKLIEARKQIGKLGYGDVAVTQGFDLPAKFVMHVVSPIWQGGSHGEIKLLASCYSKALELAVEKGCDSIAFPLLSAGNHGFPKDLALQTAISEISKFLMQNEIQVYLVVFNRSVFELSEKLFSSVQSFIDENYIREKTFEEFEICKSCAPDEADEILYRREIRRNQEIRYNIEFEDACAMPVEMMAAPVEECIAGENKQPRSLEDLVKEVDETFSESLIRLIDKKGYTDPEVYHRANIDRKLFSKIKNNKDYQPKKSTAIAFAIGLKLNLD